MFNFLEKLRNKPPATKRKIIIGIAIILILFFGLLWYKDTIKHIRRMKQENLEFPGPKFVNNF